MDYLSIKYSAPVLQYLCLLALFDLEEKLDSWRYLPFLNKRLLQICLSGTGGVKTWDEFSLALPEDCLIIVLIQS